MCHIFDMAVLSRGHDRLIAAFRPDQPMKARDVIHKIKRRAARIKRPQLSIRGNGKQVHRNFAHDAVAAANFCKTLSHGNDTDNIQIAKNRA